MRRKSSILGENDKIFSGFLLVQWVPVSDPTLDIKGQPDRGTGPGAAQMNISSLPHQNLLIVKSTDFQLFLLIYFNILSIYLLNFSLDKLSVPIFKTLYQLVMTKKYSGTIVWSFLHQNLEIVKMFIFSCFCLFILTSYLYICSISLQIS